jgi:hypothetical protein
VLGRDLSQALLIAVVLAGTVLIVAVAVLAKVAAVIVSSSNASMPINDPLCALCSISGYCNFYVSMPCQQPNL